MIVTVGTVGHSAMRPLPLCRTASKTGALGHEPACFVSRSRPEPRLTV